MAESKKYKLTYFDMPARAEPHRLAFWIGKIDFEDERVEFKDWPKLKPTTPFGSLPLLTLPDGDIGNQGRAMARFIGKKTGLYPDDAVQAMHVDEILDTCEDLQSAVNSAGKGLEKAEKEKKRVEAVTTGKGALILKSIEAFIKKHGKEGHAVGEKLTIADLYLFSFMTMAVSGFFDGIPKDLLKDYPSIQAVRKTVATHPSVVERYKAEKSANPVFKVFAAVGASL
uniref:Glutathione transferase n=1 Tax=Lotharella globosa TaxID=91324 RepID=A0A7S3Z912_9EUKA